MNADDRAYFDGLLESVLATLPARLHALLEEAPLIVEDRPAPQLLEELGMEPEEDDLLCGLHTGTPLTERSVERGAETPETIHLFREGVLDHAGGWEPWQDDDGQWYGGDDEIRRQIRITLLHEIGHHFGLDEDDLEELGYG